MISKRIKEIREAAGETQEQMGDRLGVSQRTVGHWENNMRAVSSSMVVKIADEYGLSADYVLGRMNDPGRRDESPSLDEAITKSAARGPEGQNDAAIKLLNERLNDIMSEIERYKRIINRPGKEE